MSEHLPIALSAAVPLHIAELKEQGGPTDRDFEQARAVGKRLGHKGDVLLYGGKRGEAASIFNDVAFAIAVLAFVPGGVTVFGEHWEAENDMAHE